jgi:methyl-accepting chemotaxis protein
MNHMKLSVKLIGAFAVVAVITLIVGAIGFWGVAQTDKALTEVAEVRLPSIAALDIINEAQTAIESNQRTILIPELYKDGTEIERFHLKNTEIWARVDKAWKIYEPLPQSQEEAATWKQFTPAWEAWKRDSQRFNELIKAGKRDEALGLATGPLRDSFTGAEELVTKLVQINDQIANTYSKDALAQADFDRMMVSAGMLLGVVVAVLMGVFLSRSITKPIARVQRCPGAWAAIDFQ